MNKEFVNLDEHTSIVKDEDGKTKKRNKKVNDKVLLLENKIKKVQKEKESIKIDLNQAKEEVKVAKTLLKLRPITLLGTILGGFALGGAFTGGILLSTSMSALLSGFVAGTIMYNIIATRYVSILEKAEKEVERLETKLKEANNLEQEYTNELEIAKDLLSKEDTKIDLEPVSLKGKNEIELPKVEKIIEENTNEKLEEKQKQKKLTL